MPGGNSSGGCIGYFNCERRGVSPPRKSQLGGLRVRQKFWRLSHPPAETFGFDYPPASFQWEFEPICAPVPRAQTPTKRSNASVVLAMLYHSSVAQADFCALSSAHLPLPRHNPIDCRGIRRQITKYRQIAKANRPHEGEVVGRAEPERLGGEPEKFARPAG